jgi:hypothetical protein
VDACAIEHEHPDDPAAWPGIRPAGNANLNVPGDLNPAQGIAHLPSHKPLNMQALARGGIANHGLLAGNLSGTGSAKAGEVYDAARPWMGYKHDASILHQQIDTGPGAITDYQGPPCKIHPMNPIALRPGHAKGRDPFMDKFLR